MSRKSLRRLLRAISAVPGLYSLIAFVCARRVHIDGWSMSPALLPRDRALFDRLAYIRDRPRISDVVLARHPERDLRIVKRITAVPGDSPGGRTLASGEYWLEGDNADGSSDSREFGPLSRHQLLARGWLVYWPEDHWRRL
ncbi:MAG: S26 family signal peptidase [Dehalococcoidia bacterium]